ncbi:MAG: hypothetical protein K2K84_01620, partial [Muribaculaceae bacterium]|nr:hypothetical protein [Muribaculaceae bacterium]
MKPSTLLSLSLALTATLTGTASEPSLKIYSGLPDTIKSAPTTVVAVTEPGASATVNGQTVHVYKTGSFGTKLELTPGQNTVEVTASLGGGWGGGARGGGGGRRGVV